MFMQKISMRTDADHGSLGMFRVLCELLQSSKITVRKQQPVGFTVEDVIKLRSVAEFPARPALYSLHYLTIHILSQRKFAEKG